MDDPKHVDLKGKEQGDVHENAGIPVLKCWSWNFLQLELPWPILGLQEQGFCELLCDREKCKRISTWHLLHCFPHCMRYGSTHRLRDTQSPACLCFMHSSEAQVSLSKVLLEVLDQMVSADEG